MRLEYDPIAEDFLLIDQGKVVSRVYIGNSHTVENALDAMEMLRTLRAKKGGVARTSIDKPRPQVYDESLVKRFTPSGKRIAPVLMDLELDLDF